MKGYLTDKYDYYSGDYNLYFLKAIVAREGGSEAHLRLLTYLLSNSFKNERGVYADFRCISSILHLIHSKACIFLSYYLQFEEGRIGDLIKDKYKIEVASPVEVLALNTDVHSKSVGHRISSLMRGSATSDMGYNLASLLGISYTEPTSCYLNERLDYVFSLVDLTAEERSILNSIVCRRDKSLALSYISRAWEYKESSAQELRGLLYEWKD